MIERLRRVEMMIDTGMLRPRCSDITGMVYTSTFIDRQKFSVCVMLKSTPLDHSGILALSLYRYVYALLPGMGFEPMRTLYSG